MMGLIGLMGVVLVAFLVYRSGLGGSFHYDDVANLSGLGALSGSDPFLSFLFSGTSGPLGRPLALATFFWQRGDWPHNPSAFLWVNLGIHLLNGILLYGVLRQLQAVITKGIAWGEGVNLATTGLWLIHPLLLSTSLLTIQRMTSLSATWVLGGLLLFLWGRQRLVLNRPGGYLAMTAGIGAGTLLAILTKENGILLPLYALVLEVTLLSRSPIVSSHFRWWRGVFLYSPLLLILCYSVWQLPTLSGSYSIRDFTLPERLMTEARVVTRYLFLLLAPDRAQLGPFHDDFPVVRQLDVVTLLMAAFWLAIPLWALIGRQRQPLLAFAVLWFVVGHVLESTLFPLELYFEHRNYLAAIGPLFVLVYFALKPYDSRLITLSFRFVFGLYFVAVTYVAHSAALVWGNPPLSAALWVEQHPQSVRAAQFLAQTLAGRGDWSAALGVLDRASERIDDDTALALQSLILGCQHDIPMDVAARLESLLGRIQRSERYSSTTFMEFGKLVDLIGAAKCPDLTADRIRALGEALLAKRAYAQEAKALHWLHHAIARLYLRARDFGGVVHHLEAASRAYPDLNTGLMLASVLASGGQKERAMALLATLKQDPPGRSILHAPIRQEIERIEAAIGQIPPPPTTQGSTTP